MGSAYISVLKQQFLTKGVGAHRMRPLQFAVGLFPLQFEGWEFLNLSKNYSIINLFL